MGELGHGMLCGRSTKCNVYYVALQADQLFTVSASLPLSSEPKPAGGSALVEPTELQQHTVQQGTYRSALTPAVDSTIKTAAEADVTTGTGLTSGKGRRKVKMGWLKHRFCCFGPTPDS